MDGEQAFYLMRRGEVMEESCLRCHSTPEAAPAELVAHYGPDRSFDRQAGEVVSALSIRIPVTAAYAEADAVAARMSGVLLGLLIIVMASFYMLTRSMVVRPIQAVSAGAREMQSGARPLSDGVQARGPIEIRELGDTIDAFALDLAHRITQLEAASAEARAAGATRDRFLANLSHELRTPLNAIIGYASTMKMGLAGPLTAEQLAQVDTIHDSGRHLLSLVEELLEYTVLEAGVDRVTVTRFAPCKAVTNVVRLFHPLAAEKGIELLGAECRCDFEVHSDRFKLEQILVNLVGNAIKFTERGRITVSTSREGESLRIDIADTGVGIPPAQRETVFEKFTQIQAGGVGKPAGTGLGLSISREYAHLLGGDITVVSIPGAGSVFTLRIPLVHEQADSPDGPDKELPAE